MKKIELKDVVGYLPYGLYCLNCDDMIEEIDLYNVNNLIRGLDLQDETEYNELAASQQYKPVLRPLDDLYRTITHNGKKIIPIVELAKLSLPGYEWTLEDTMFAIANIGGNNARFKYSENSKSFFVYYNSIEVSNNQYKLFDFLHELKIDYRGLIDEGLAVDANTLEINPYKQLKIKEKWTH